MNASWKSLFAPVNGRSIHYLRTGGGEKPPLLLIHGFSDSGAAWSRVAREFEADYDVIMPDMHGHGLSSRFGNGSAPDMSSDIAALIAKLSIEHPVICGHSMGAMATFQTAVRYPGIAKAVFLEDPPWLSGLSVDGETSERWVSGGIQADNPVARWAKTLADKTLEELIAECRRDNPSWTEETVIAMCEAKKNLDQGIIDTLAAILESSVTAWERGISSLRIPVGLMTGNPERGGIVTASVIDRVRSLKSDIMVSTDFSVGHLIHFDAHEAFTAALRAFLSRL